MADMLGVSAPFLTDVEKDRRNPFDIEKLNQLAHILELTKEEKVKYEIAEELGLLDRVLTQGWKSLSSKETGRIGGLMNKRRQEKDRQ